MIGLYGSSPKVKCREGMYGASQLIAELQISSRDRVSISPRSCVNFARSVQAEIVCRFRRDRVSISPGDRLEFVGDRLKFEKSSPRWRIVGREEIEEMKEGSTEIGRQKSKTGHIATCQDMLPVDSPVDRWRRPVDRCARHAQG